MALAKPDEQPWQCEANEESEASLAGEASSCWWLDSSAGQHLRSRNGRAFSLVRYEPPAQCNCRVTGMGGTLRRRVKP